MAIVKAKSSNTVSNAQSVTFIGNGLPQGNEIKKLHLTGGALKINASAPTNEPNNMVAANSQNTINGQENNALQGGKPEIAAAAAFANEIGSNDPSNAVGAAGIQQAAANCDSPKSQPILLWNGGFSGSLNNPCDCYVSTGVSLLAILTVFAGGARILYRMGVMARKVKNVKNALAMARKMLKQMTGGRRRFTRDWKIRYDKKHGIGTATDKMAAEAYTNEKRKYAADVARILEEQNAGATRISEASALYKRLELYALAEVIAGMVGVPIIAQVVANIDSFTTLYRKKECKGDNTSLNQTTCDCDCDLATPQTLNENSISAQSTEICYSPGAVSYFDKLLEILVNEVPGFNQLLSGPEVEGCYLPCQCAETQQTDMFGNELCKCFCNPNEFGFTTKLRTLYGRHPDAATDCPFGQSLNTATCCCECPTNSDVYLGKTCGTHARLVDNLDDPAVGSTGHYLYETGCDCVCDGRDYVGTWPPECPAGKVWSGDPHTCDCVVAGTACFTGKILVTTHSSGIGDPSFTGCDAGLDAAVVDAGQEYESTECWCAGEPEPSEGINCGQFNPAFNIDCRTDMDEATANSLVGSRQVYNGLVSWYTGLTWYPDVQDCTLCS